MGDSAREYHAKQAKSLIPLMKLPNSTDQRTSQNNALRLNEINHLRGDSYRIEYRRDRPVPEAMKGAAFAHFSKIKFGPNLVALPSGVQRAIPTNGASFI